ncbi:MAG TPA: M23 family metallopeptidase [Solirubrobacteraceae bacterium]|nr:M23 family metallopeptidase [Solirubrobacteraceae bacterium]
MRRRLLLAPALALLAVPSPGLAQSGGAPTPGPTGGAGYGQTVGKLVATRFTVSPGTLQPGGGPATFRYRVDGPASSVRVRIDLLPAGGRHAAKRLRLGYKRTGKTLRYVWTPAAGALTPGDYVARLVAVDRGGRTLRRSARASGKSALAVAPPPAPPASVPQAPVMIGAGFPVRGPYTLGDGFGAGRAGHTHRGQDILAAEGTPVASPRTATVFWRAYQAEGAGHYVVVRADDGRDLVFMHLKDGSITVDKDDTVVAGQPFAQVGSTGSSTAPHLHLEIWPDGWFSSDASLPIDPLPDLMAWAGS